MHVGPFTPLEPAIAYTNIIASCSYPLHYLAGTQLFFAPHYWSFGGIWAITTEQDLRYWGQWTLLAPRCMDVEPMTRGYPPYCPQYPERRYASLANGLWDGFHQ